MQLLIVFFYNPFYFSKFITPFFNFGYKLSSLFFPFINLSKDLSVLLMFLNSQTFFFFPHFLGLHLQHMEVPRLGVELELQLLAYTTAMGNPSHTCDLRDSSWQCQIPTQWARPRIKPASSGTLLGFVSAAPQWELLIGNSWFHWFSLLFFYHLL